MKPIRQRFSPRLVLFLELLMVVTSAVILVSDVVDAGQRKTRSSQRVRRSSSSTAPTPTPTPSPVVYVRTKEATLWKLPSRDPRAQALVNRAGSYIPQNVTQSPEYNVEFGDRLTVLDKYTDWEIHDAWYKVITPDESKSGWIHPLLVTDSLRDIEAIRNSHRVPSVFMINARYTPEGFKQAAYRIQGYLEDSQYHDGVIKLLPGQAVYFPIDVNVRTSMEARNYANEFTETPTMQSIFIVNEAGKLEPWKY